ncbi:hypothetical protein [Hydrotalea flava]|uniref:hypothetical protein n=1 Tax=Hydrotalea flava TaxID=714549 RepID=UPI000A8BC292|nr:hypothetical protein [Hydrotalea flava]
MPQSPNILLHAVPAFVSLIIVEVVYAYHIQKELYHVKDTATNIALGLGNFFTGIFTKGFILLFFTWLYTHRIYTIPYTAWWAWVLLFFADDFSYYWFHRMAHTVR